MFGKKEKTFTCDDCGGSFPEPRPERCPKCSAFQVRAATPAFQDIDEALRSSRRLLEKTELLITVRAHRKAKFLVAQIRRAIESIDVAIEATQVANSPKKTSGKMTPPHVKNWRL